MRTPISLSVEAAYRHAQDHGFVYTFRSDDRTTGLVWVREGRTRERTAYGVLNRVGRVSDVLDLREDWVRNSGFYDRAVWTSAILQQHGSVDGAVYLLTISSWKSETAETVDTVECPSGCGVVKRTDRIGGNTVAVTECPDCGEPVHHVGVTR